MTTSTSDTLYAINDALTALANQFCSIPPDDDVLNDLTHHVAREFGLTEEPTVIDRFLAAGAYESLDAWMIDSGYEQRDGDWYYGPEDPNCDEFPDLILDPEGVILGAIEASGFETDNK